MTCTRPPPGWRCTRPDAPHDGPCAALPVNTFHARSIEGHACHLERNHHEAHECVYGEWHGDHRYYHALLAITEAMERASAAHDPSNPRHPSHGGQHTNGPCCEFGNLNPSGAIAMTRWAKQLRAVLDGES